MMQDQPLRDFKMFRLRMFSPSYPLLVWPDQNWTLLLLNFETRLRSIGAQMSWGWCDSQCSLVGWRTRKEVLLLKFFLARDPSTFKLIYKKMEDISRFVIVIDSGHAWITNIATKDSWLDMWDIICSGLLTLQFCPLGFQFKKCIMWEGWSFST